MATNSFSTLPSGQSFASSIQGLPVNTAENPTLLSMSGTGGILGSLYGQIPGVANPLSSAQLATEGDTGNLENLANLTQGTDTLSAEGASLPFQMNLPDYEGMLTSATGNVSQELQGQVPQDVLQQLQEGAAERGIATGEGPNSPNANANYLQDLGLTSLGLEGTGLSGLTSLIGSTPTGASFNPSSMFVTPSEEQSAQQAVQQNMAAPDPAASGIFSSIMSLL